MSDQEIARRGLIMVLSSPSGAGKTTLTRLLLEGDANLTLSVSVTTRPKRPNEVHGVHYSFIERSEFEALASAGELLEYATVFGNSYGTPRAAVDATLSSGRDVIADIDWQGTQQLAQSALKDDLVKVFILPPSLPELERRLTARNQDSHEVVAGRMAKAQDEMSHWAEYDYVIVNTDLDRSLAVLQSILVAERAKRSRQVGLVEFMRGMVRT
jgi:guanylate kinase